ncbi:UNKNOWN [Stylonychia lemnae]|uniref:Uncharacterized protein n=1 Tax=Stylonychia lemnae TaxID=5949 RepID=A0A078B2D5_STYLE|nr:UNKNOWN [Stylonychia lemnae]|eukprot:CDW87638.1 UNKNOWN [Stylonychia lemnae]
MQSQYSKCWQRISKDILKDTNNTGDLYIKKIIDSYKKTKKDESMLFEDFTKGRYLKTRKNNSNKNVRFDISNAQNSTSQISQGEMQSNNNDISQIYTYDKAKVSWNNLNNNHPDGGNKNQQNQNNLNNNDEPIQIQDMSDDSIIEESESNGRKVKRIDYIRMNKDLIKKIKTNNKSLHIFSNRAINSPLSIKSKQSSSKSRSGISSPQPLRLKIKSKVRCNLNQTQLIKSDRSDILSKYLIQQKSGAVDLTPKQPNKHQIRLKINNIKDENHLVSTEFKKKLKKYAVLINKQLFSDSKNMSPTSSQTNNILKRSKFNEKLQQQIKLQDQYQLDNLNKDIMDRQYVNNTATTNITNFMLRDDTNTEIGLGIGSGRERNKRMSKSTQNITDIYCKSIRGRKRSEDSANLTQYMIPTPTNAQKSFIHHHHHKNILSLQDLPQQMMSDDVRKEEIEILGIKRIRLRKMRAIDYLNSFTSQFDPLQNTQAVQ